MESWVGGLVAVVVVGLGLIVFGALHDRARNRRRAAEILAPPERPIPNLPASARGPAYVTELQARRAPVAVAERPRDAPAPESGPQTVRIAAGWASSDFVTERAGRRVVLQSPVVMVCADEVGSVRELLPVLERVLKASVPLVLVAPSLDPQVLGTLEVNVIQRKVELVVVLADNAIRTQVAELSGATPVDRSERQAGFLPADHLGRVERWDSTREASLLTPVVW